MVNGLEISQVSVRYGATTAVNGVSLTVPLGSALAILGPSGCGKSTLLRVVAGLETAYSGAVAWGGRDLRGVAPHRRRFAMVFQDGQLFDHLSVAGNVGYGLASRGVRGAGDSRAARASRVEELLMMVGLAGMGGRRPATLSGGERQRVALARALAPRPDVLLLDEPLSALDRSLREHLAAEVRALLTATGTTAVLVTHDHDEALTIGDTVAVMRRGRIVQAGPGAAVWRAPADEETARFLGCSTVLHGDAAAEVLATAGGLAGGGGAGSYARGGSVLDGASVGREATRAEGAGAGEAGGYSIGHEGTDVAGSGIGLRRNALRVAADGALTGTVVRVAAATDALRLVVDVPHLGEVEALGDIASGIEPGQSVRLAVDPAGLAFLGDPPR